MRCGIDFGTSNTSMAVYDDAARKSYLVPLEDGLPTIPTALFFAEDNASVFFGRHAVNAYLNGVEGRFMRSMKRVLGTSLMDSAILINGVRSRFDYVVGRFITHIKQQAETALQRELTKVTLGRPVFFQDDLAADHRAEKQLQKIAEICGFKQVSFQYEPIAAALTHERKLRHEQLALVIDIGGGTSDFSVIRLDPSFIRQRDRRQDILANNGIRIGGNDCDKAINLDAAMPLFGLHSRYGQKNLDMPVLIYHELSEWAKINWCYAPQNILRIRELLKEAHEPRKIQYLEEILEDQLGHHVLNRSEEMKIHLTQEDIAHIALDFITEDLSISMTRKRMNDLLDDVLEPVHEKMLDVLKMAGIGADNIGAVILTGGSTALPVFQKWVAKYFSKADILQEDRLESVGLGLVL